MRIVRTARGARLVHGRHVLSEVLSRPGPTRSIFDLLSACAFVLAPPGRVAMLGFAAGGMLAPLRALGSVAPIEAVDLSTEAAPLFRALCGSWAGAVRVTKGDALAWLRAQPGKWQAVIEDLSRQIPGDVTKPEVSLGPLPAVIARKLSSRGVAVINALPVPGLPFTRVLQALCAPYPQAVVLSPAAFENRVVVAGRRLPPARVVRARVLSALEQLGSPLALGLGVRTYRPLARAPQSW